MRTTRNWMLGLALVAGMLGAGAATAKAAPIQFQVGINEGYVPPCPGDGYAWVAGYYNGPYWVPGSWIFRGHGWDRRPAYGYGYREPAFRGDYGRGGYGYRQGFDRDRNFHDRDFHGRDNHGDRDRGNDRGRGFDHRR